MSLANWGWRWLMRLERRTVWWAVILFCLLFWIGVALLIW